MAHSSILAERQNRFTWSKRFIPQYQIILAAHFGVDPSAVKVASYEDDYYSATDLIVGDIRIAAKTRRHKIYLKYGKEFALRHQPNLPYRTEYEKIVQDGHSHYLLYSFCDPTETILIDWSIIDLDVLRRAYGPPGWHWAGCVLPSIIHDPDEDVGLISWRKDMVIDPDLDIGQLVIAERSR